MAIAVESANILTFEVDDGSTTNPAISQSHSLQNASGNDRLVVLSVAAGSGQSGTVTFTNVFYDSTAPTGNVYYAPGGTNRMGFQIFWWDDAALPSTAGSYTVSVTPVGMSTSNPITVIGCVEATGVDQTTPKSETEVTNNAFGTTTQTYTPPPGGRLIFGLIDGAGGTTDPTVTWGTGDSEIFQATLSGGGDRTFGAGYALDGSFSATLSEDMTNERWLAVAFNDNATIVLDAPTVSVSSRPASMTVSPGSNRKVFVFCATGDATDATPASSVSLGGQALTQIGIRDTSGHDVAITAWELDETGIAAMVGNSFSISGETAASQSVYLYYSVNNADQSTPTVVASGITGTTDSTSVTRAAESITGVLHIHDALNVFTSASNPDITPNDATYDGAYAYGWEVEADSDRTVNYTWSNSQSRNSAWIVVNQAPVSAGGSSLPIFSRRRR